MILYARNTITAPLFCGVLLLFAASCRNATSDMTSANSNASTESNADTRASENSAESPSAAATPSDEATSLVAEGRKHFEEFRNDEAIKAFERALEIYPDSGETHYRLGLALDDAGEDERATKSYGRAVELFEKTLSDDEENISVQRLLALTYSKLDKHAEAVKAYRQVARLAPDESYNHYELGVELMKLAQYPEAAQALKRATQLDPDNYQAAEAYDRAREGIRRRDFALKKQEEELRRQNPDDDSAPAQPRSGSGKIVPTLPIRLPKPTPTPAPKTP